MNPNFEIKKAVIWAIGNLKMKKGLHLLKILYNSTNSPLKVEILKAIYKITDGKGNFLNQMFLSAFRENIEEVRIGALELFLRTDKKLFYKDVKGIFDNVSSRMKVLKDKLILENRIVNISGGNL